MELHRVSYLKGSISRENKQFPSKEVSNSDRKELHYCWARLISLLHFILTDTFLFSSLWSKHKKSSRCYVSLMFVSLSSCNFIHSYMKSLYHHWANIRKRVGIEGDSDRRWKANSFCYSNTDGTWKNKITIRLQ